jgi:cell division protein FtsQ
MLQSTNKYKMYIYFLFFFFLSSIFNPSFLENSQKKFVLKNIKITGLSDFEKKIILNELKYFQEKNIFKINKNMILEKLNKYNYLDHIYVKKIIPSSIILNLSKTSIIGKTHRYNEIYYIGKNGKFISSQHLDEMQNLPMVFGDFKIQEFLNLQYILNLHQLENNNIEKYFYYKNNRWDLLFSNGVTLKLPSKNVEKKLKIYKRLLNNDKLINKKIIDLRMTNQIILTPNNE